MEVLVCFAFLRSMLPSHFSAASSHNFCTTLILCAAVAILAQALHLRAPIASKSAAPAFVPGVTHLARHTELFLLSTLCTRAPLQVDRGSHHG